MKTSTVRVVPYDLQWPLAFEHQARALASLFLPEIVQAYHIGSTSVPGMWAKPVVDLIIAVDDLAGAKRCFAKIQALGYTYEAQAGLPFHFYFHRADSHLHIFEKGSPEISHAVCFRNWLRAYPKDAQAYADLKKHLAALYPNDLRAYGAGKGCFIRSIDAQSGFDGLRMVSLLSPHEEKAYKRLAGRTPDPSWTNFVFYKGVSIIAAGSIHGADMKLWASSTDSTEKDACQDLLRRWQRFQRKA